ncbi:hypothetical protein ANN_19660 [Periplaneta americana]|uniref:Uncharacterized protein n=1 Tax=Periplaneta americana TaxID=6978 RepID=A0ABQ8SAI5_PERAM|nr:hypothetical protein ANN_19660 [Periplaneta americana]
MHSFHCEPQCDQQKMYYYNRSFKPGMHKRHSLRAALPSERENRLTARLKAFSSLDVISSLTSDSRLDAYNSAEQCGRGAVHNDWRITYVPEKLTSKYDVHSEEYVPKRTKRFDYPTKLIYSEYNVFNIEQMYKYTTLKLYYENRRSSRSVMSKQAHFSDLDVVCGHEALVDLKPLKMIDEVEINDCEMSPDVQRRKFCLNWLGGEPRKNAQLDNLSQREFEPGPTRFTVGQVEF